MREMGDFQTPPELAERVCRHLAESGIRPRTVVEPTCGAGSFLAAAAAAFPDADVLLGLDLNRHHAEAARTRLAHDPRVRVSCGNVFDADFSLPDGDVLVLGNPPWVTNSAQGRARSHNLPEKSNPGLSGLDALTGKSNFDISEAILKLLARRVPSGTMAMLVKERVARNLAASGIFRDMSFHRVDAGRSFGVSVAACLFVGSWDGRRQVGGRREVPVRSSIGGPLAEVLVAGDGAVRRKVAGSMAAPPGCPPLPKWRSGVKHDASKVFELGRATAGLVNGFGETVDVERELLFPLFKGTDVARNIWRDRWLLVPQTAPGKDMGLAGRFPKASAYLESHRDVLDARRSRIYAGKPPFSIFGVGPYTFAPWKVAVSSLHREPAFRLFGPVAGKPAVFDDTVYLLSFDSERDAVAAFRALTSGAAKEWLAVRVFDDDKRAVKASLLNGLSGFLMEGKNARD